MTPPRPRTPRARAAHPLVVVDRSPAAAAHLPGWLASACAASLLSLAACGGGGGDATAALGGSSGASDGLATRDEHSFAAAWVTHGLLGHIPYALRMVGLNGPCAAGGSAITSSVTGVTTLDGCRLADQPDLAYTGDITVSLAASGQPGQFSATVRFSVVNQAANNSTVSVATTAVDYSVVSTTSSDIVTWSAAGVNSVDFTFGGSSSRHVKVSNLSATNSQFAGTGADFVRTTTAPQFVFTNGTDTWQFNGSSAIREAAGSLPDTGGFALLRQGVSPLQTLIISLKADGVISFGQGEDGKIVARKWSDSDVVSALTAAVR